MLGAAVLLAGAFLSKLSAPILVPVALVMLAVRVIGGRPLALDFRGTTVEYTSRARQLAILLGVVVVFGLVMWALIWASFGFRYTAFAAATTGKDAFLGQVTDQPGLAGRVPLGRAAVSPAARGVHLRLAAHGAVRGRARGVSQRSVRDDRLVVVLSRTRSR